MEFQIRDCQNVQQVATLLISRFIETGWSIPQSRILSTYTAMPNRVKQGTYFNILFIKHNPASPHVWCCSVHRMQYNPALSQYFTVCPLFYCCSEQNYTNSLVNIIFGSEKRVVHQKQIKTYSDAEESQYKKELKAYWVKYVSKGPKY